MDTLQDLRTKRDARATPHLMQYAPVWLLEEKLILNEDAIQFNVVFQHPEYGWVNRRYRYDGFNDVLYHKGQTLIGEGTLEELQKREPFLQVSVADIPNSYGG